MRCCRIRCTRKSSVGVLNPTEDTFDKTITPLLAEAYEIIASRHARRVQIPSCVTQVASWTRDWMFVGIRDPCDPGRFGRT